MLLISHRPGRLFRLNPHRVNAEKALGTREKPRVIDPLDGNEFQRAFQPLFQVQLQVP
jgi:hypothetical protein